MCKFLSSFQMNFELCLHEEDSKELEDGYSWKAEKAEQRLKLLPTMGETVFRV